MDETTGSVGGRQLLGLVIAAVSVLVAGFVVLSSGDDAAVQIVAPPFTDAPVVSVPASSAAVSTSPMPMPVGASTIATSSSTTSSTTSTVTTSTVPGPTSTSIFAPAVADAGVDTEVDVESDVVLAAVDLSEPNQSVVWRQVTGPDVTGGTGRFVGARFEFVAPERPSTLIFEMTVTGRSGDTAVDSVRVDVFADASSAVFVDAAEGSDGGDGSRQRPFRTVDAAVSATSPGTDLYVRSGGRTLRLGRTPLTGGRSVFGGYDSDWVRVGESTRISATDGLRLEGPGAAVLSSVVVLGGNTVAAAVGVDASGLDRLTVEDVEIVAGRSTTGSSTGLQAIDVGAVELVRSTVRAGRGGDGARGASGSAATDEGVNGSAAVGTSGGRGGGNGADGEDGGVPGGSGADGTDGADGIAGTNGVGGEGLGSPDAPDPVGAAGDAGGTGGRGAGGGGGRPGTSVGVLAGGGGGGGGGGGDGGAGGGGGAGGSGSVGVAFVDVGVVLVVDTVIDGGSAGRGGAGGVGGLGAAGGAGGVGGDGESAGGSSAGTGGAGGSGGAGGRGGIGGAGAGGASVGLLTARVGDVTVLDTTINAGPGGPGGAATNGGDSIGWWTPVGASATGEVVVERTMLRPGTPGVGGRALERLGVV
ncbi:MAG: hypothetical protein RLZZ01_397 [Actinomycetota bacterium]